MIRVNRGNYFKKENEKERGMITFSGSSQNENKKDGIMERMLT